MGGVGNAPIVLWIFTFYIVIFSVMGLVSETVNDGSGISASTVTPPTPPEEFSILDMLTGAASFLWSAISIFFQGMMFSITGIPTVFTVILFMPLSIVLFYIGMSFARGSS